MSRILKDGPGSHWWDSEPHLTGSLGNRRVKQQSVAGIRVQAPRSMEPVVF